MKITMDLEDIYIQKLKEYINPEGIRKLSIIKELQINFFSNAINEIHNINNHIKENFYNYCNEISNITNLTVNNIDEINNRSSIIISNHIGIAKLIKLKLVELPLKSSMSKKMKDLENNESYVLRIAHIIAYLNNKITPSNIHPITIKYKYPFSKICNESSFLLLDKKDNFNKIKNYIQRSLNNNKIPQYFIIFPEGRTSGKYNNKGIFDLDTFHSGFFELAKQTKLPIFSFTQYFNPNIDFHIDIKKYDKQCSIEEIRKHMQTQLLLNYN